MLICRIALVASLVACLSYCALALDPGTKLLRVSDTPTATTSATPLVSMRHTAGWGNGVVRSFTLNGDGSFTWIKGGKREKSPLTLGGKLSQEDVKSLIEKLQAAGEGPGAEDAGYVAIEFINSDGKLKKKGYSMPGTQPAAALLALIDELAQKNGKAQATLCDFPDTSTAPAAGATTGPATKPAEISQDDARKIAEETLIKRKTDPSALSYNGTTLFTDADGKKFWRVSYGPKQPPQVEGRPRAMINGGQVIVLVAVDTGETKMLLGM